MAISPISRLRRRASINVYEHTAADEIVAAYHISIGAPVKRDADLGMPAGWSSANSADAPAAWQVDVSNTYSSWRKDISDTPEYAVARMVLFNDAPLSTIDSEQGWRKGTAKGYLVRALRHFAALRGNTPRGVHWRMDR